MRRAGASTLLWLRDCRGRLTSTCGAPRIHSYHRSPTIPPKAWRSITRWAVSRSALLKMPAAFSRAFILRLMPVQSVRARVGSMDSRAAASRMTSPLGFCSSVAIFARKPLGATPMLQFMAGEISRQIVSFIVWAMARARSGCCSEPISPNSISSMLATRCTGMMLPSTRTISSWYAK